MKQERILCMESIASFFNSNPILLIFVISVLGYLLGSITVAGLQLGTSGLLLVALVFGHFGMDIPALVRDYGLAAFVTAVGFIAGPVFFRNFKSKAFSYVLLGFIIIVAGASACVACITIFNIPADLSVGILSGALTTTPGLAAAIEATGSDMPSIGYGIAYPFGVVGVVLFVQLLPKLLKYDIKKEAAMMEQALGKSASARSSKKDLFEFDAFGFMVFAIAVVLGVLIGKIVIPLPGGASFSFGTSGGPLLAGLIIGHFAHVGRVSITPPRKTLEVMRELGLALFLMGAGTNAGRGFVVTVQQYGIQLFILGALITLLPMVAGYFIARKALKLDMISTLGSICGGMTSTPALGALLSSTGNDAATPSYAATYPAALVFVVLAAQFISIIFKVL